MTMSRRIIGFINIGHMIDHMFMLIFPTAVLSMGSTFARSYSDLIALALGGFIAFGAGSFPAGWLGDRWSRRNMMAIFFFGIGVDHPMSLEDIGEKFNLTRERVRQIKDKAITKLRSNSRSKMLRSYLGI